MFQKTIQNHTHDDIRYNCTHLQAWTLGWLISRYSWYNLLYWFQPPVLDSVAIIPKRKDLVDPQDQFTPDMFRHGALFEQVPLNHYLRLHKRGTNEREGFFINAGFLLQSFLLGPKYGYATLKELIRLAEKELSLSNTNSSEEGTDVIQETSGWE